MIRTSFPHTVAALALAGGFMMADAQPARACDAEPLIGSVCIVAFDWCPEGYYSATGQTISMRQSQALYVLIQQNFGGSASQQTAVLPNLQGRVPVGTGTGPGLSPVAIAAQRGAVSPIITQIASHSHTATFAGTGATQPTVSVDFRASGTPASSSLTPAGNPFLGASASSGVSSAKMWGGTLASPVNMQGITQSVTGNYSGFTGGTVAIGASPAPANSTVSVLPPMLGVTYCIAWNGIFPIKD